MVATGEGAWRVRDGVAGWVVGAGGIEGRRRMHEKRGFYDISYRTLERDA